MSKLTNKQQAFVDYYLLNGFNAYQAAKSAGYKGNYQTLRAIASQNLTKARIKAAIQARMNDLTISANETLARISAQATASIGDFLVVDEERGGAARIDLETAKKAGKLGVIKKYKETETIRTNKHGDEIVTIKREIELYPADNALDKLMRYHGLYRDTIKVETWQDKIVDALRNGRISPEDVAERLPSQLANEFFSRAGLARGS